MIALALTDPAAAAAARATTARPPADASPAATVDCSQLAVGDQCSVDYAQHPSQTAVIIPANVGTVTVLLSGASGGGGGSDEQGAAGSGGTVIATIDVSSERTFDVWLGRDGTGLDGRAPGWASGGAGGRTDLRDGAAGGGASGLSWASAGHDQPLLVAGGGGGGGAENHPGLRNGGPGGAGGNPPQSGSRGVSTGVWGEGGKGGGAGHPDGDGGAGSPVPFAMAGGGGGGGGYPHGGGGGGAGTQELYDPAGSGGGGGGGDSYASPGVHLIAYTSGHVGDGQLTIFAGTPQRYDCIDSWDPRVLDVPSDVTAYAFVATGGSGTHGHNNAIEGTGAIVTGTLDVEGVRALKYWVGCDGYYFGGAGFGKPGHKGGGGAGANDGGDGGGATMIADQESGTPYVVAGGGGGTGGDAPSGNPCPGDQCGGEGGSSGGKAGTRFPAAGGWGGGNGGRGGCADCHGGAHPNHDGGNGTSGGFDTGGGGGGGAGYPAGGGGGHHDDLSPGGGGGAGGSYLSSRRVAGGSIAASGVDGNGYILLLPVRGATSALTVRKDVTGAAASYAKGPFTADVSCAVGSQSTLRQSIVLGPHDAHTFPRVLQGSRCTVTETGGGGASTPAPPQTVTVGTAPAAVTLTNEFAATSFSITVRSTIQAEGGGPNPGVGLTLGDLGVHVACSLNGAAYQLPAPVRGGQLTFAGNDTLRGGGVTMTVANVPVGSTCHAVEAPGSGATAVAYRVDGGTPGGDGATFHLGTAPNAVDVGNTYRLAPLNVTKRADGDTPPPPGATYAGDVSCTFQGRPVTLPATAGFSAAVGATAAVHDLPVGARCTVDETDRGTAVAVAYAPSQTVTITLAPAAAVTITNTFDTGSLLVSVSAGGPGAQWANQAYTVHVTCRQGAATVLDQTFTTGSPAGGWRAFTPSGGASCTAEETGRGGASQVSYASGADRAPSPSPVSVAAPANGTATLTVANRFDAAPLTVQTSTGGAGARFARPATVTVGDCAFNGMPIDAGGGEASVAFTLPAAGGTASIPELVTGAACTVTQTDAGGATASTFTPVDAEPSSAPSSDSVRVTVNRPAGGASTGVRIANTFGTAALSVTMRITGAAAWAANAPFEVTVRCTFDGQPLAEIGPDGTVALHYTDRGALVPDAASDELRTLPLGARCDAAQTVAGGATATAYDPAGPGGGRSGTVAILLGGRRITVTNAFSATSLTVTKALSGNDAATHAGDEFWFEVGCTFNGHILPAPPTDPARPSVFTLVAGGARTYDELPAGAACSVTEFGTQHATQVSPDRAQTATLPAAPATLSFTNAFDVAPLTVREVVTGDGAATYGLGQTFVARVECDWPDGSGGSADLPGDGIVRLSAAGGFTARLNAPYGATCRVSQGMQMATVQTLPPPVTMGLGDEHELTITSEYRLGTIAVSKLAQGDHPAGRRFGFQARCAWQEDGGPAAPIPLNGGQPGDFGLRSGDAHTVVALSGARCTVTETDAGGARQVVVSVRGVRGSTGERSAAVQLEHDAPAAAAFTNRFAGAPPPPTPSGAPRPGFPATGAGPGGGDM